jgi:hypothetical protein
MLNSHKKYCFKANNAHGSGLYGASGSLMRHMARVALMAHRERLDHNH